MRLFIAEKPSLGRAIAENLKGPHKTEDGYIRCGDDIVTWCFGHIFELAMPEQYNEKYKSWSLDALPIIPDHWKICLKQDAKKQFQIIKKLVSQADEIVHAGDPDREGQLLVDEVLDEIGNKKPVLRIWLSATDPVSVKRALSAMKSNKEFEPLKFSAIARSRADWLVGINLTRAYTLLAQKSGYQGVVSIGRVQTPTLALVVNRDKEIESFVPKDYYDVRAKIHVQRGDFWATWIIPDGYPGLDSEDRLVDKTEADKVVARTQGKNGYIEQYSSEKKQESPPLPFSLDTLQEYASARFGMGAQKVLDVCQSLYEKQLTTYPRTDSQHLPQSQIEDAKHIIGHLAKNFQAARNADLSLRSEAWNDGKVTAHHAIIPTRKSADMNSLNEDEKKIYEAICLRYIAQFYPPRLYNSVKIIVRIGDDRFKASGADTISLGWRSIYSDDHAEEQEKDENVTLPKTAQGEKCIANPVEAVKLQTKPPARFTEGALIRAMTNVHKFVENPEIRKKLKETDGIGTNATRAGIITTLLKRGFLQKKGKTIQSTPAGRSLIELLPISVKDPGLTAIWESALEKISKGEMDVQTFLDFQYKNLAKLIEQAQNMNVCILQKQATSKIQSRQSKKAKFERKKK